MCRLFGAVLEKPGCPEALERFRFQSISNPHGWGIAWYTSRKLHIEKSVKSALEDIKYPAVLRKLHSNLVIAHLRKMTRGNIRKVNSHPFTLNKFVFAHNGSVDIDGLVNYLKNKYKKFKGTTDSEILFYYLVQQMEKYGNFMGLRKAVKEITKEAKTRKITSLNFLLTDERYLYAYKRVFRGSNSLFYKKTEGFNKSILFSSKPIGVGWIEMKNGELLVVDSQDLSLIRTLII